MHRTCAYSSLDFLVLHADFSRLMPWLWPPYAIGQAVIFLPCGFFLLSSIYLFSSPNLSRRRLDVYSLPYFDTWCGPSANLECRSETCYARLAANTGRKNHFGNIAQLCWAISSELRHLSTIGKNLLNSNTSFTCPDNMVNFGLLAAEIVSLVWGTPANFSRFCVLAALLHGTLVVGVSQTLRRWTETQPIFGRAAITLGIGPHSSINLSFSCQMSILP